MITRWCARIEVREVGGLTVSIEQTFEVEQGEGDSAQLVRHKANEAAIAAFRKLDLSKVLTAERVRGADRSARVYIDTYSTPPPLS